ncbi:MAG: class I SAM-dependent methyltransferase [Eubacteriales bacterium]
MNRTLVYYNENAEQYIQDTANVEFSKTQNTFLDRLHSGASVLDFGCGSARDVKYFIERGFKVEAIDGSIELCDRASKYTGIKVKCMLFQELDEIGKYDGIWACSSILHLSKEELKIVLRKMSRALKDNGIIYTSFKYSEFEGERNGRYFTDFTEEEFGEFLIDLLEIEIEEQWITGDVRPDRGDERWLNIILRKKWKWVWKI